LISENRRYQQHQYEPSFRNPKGFGDTVGKYFPKGQYEGEFGRFFADVRKGNSDCNIESSVTFRQVIPSANHGECGFRYTQERL
jgi:hypothetical protein